MVNLRRKRDGARKPGLVWKCNGIDADAASNANVIACTVDRALLDGPSAWRNRVIEGHDFAARRRLRMTHASRVQCLYIVPPCITGNMNLVCQDRHVDLRYPA